MQVEVIYHQGRLAFAQPIRLRQRTFKITVDIPDAELLLPDAMNLPSTAVPTNTSPIRERIDAILAPYQNQLFNKCAFTPKDYKAMWHEHLWGKYIGKC